MKKVKTLRDTWPESARENVDAAHAEAADYRRDAEFWMAEAKALHEVLEMLEKSTRLTGKHLHGYIVEALSAAKARKDKIAA